jgi:hypothetical protein
MTRPLVSVLFLVFLISLLVSVLLLVLVILILILIPVILVFLSDCKLATLYFKAVDFTQFTK